ncbi:MAG: AAA family ATPase [Firmicutes bacterium]|nr:AAA family ATPase [Bacillota bacterium]
MNLENIYSPEAENAVIAGFLIDENTRHLVEVLKPDDFYDPVNREVFEAIRRLHRENKPIDLLTLHEASKVAMTRITAYDTPTTVNIQHHIGIIKDKTAKREFAAVQQKVHKLLQEDISRVDLKNTVLKLIDGIDVGVSQEDGSLRAVLVKTFNELQKEGVSYRSGIDELDKKMGGFHKGEMTCIAARPSRGKTALVLQVAQGMACRGVNVLLVSKEMSKVQLGKRILARNARIDGFRLRSNNLSTEDWENVKREMAKLCSLPIVIDTESSTVPEIRAKARKEKADIVMIDYLQLLKSVNKEQSREREVAEMSRDLKNMTLEMDIPVIILAQLNRNAEDKRPSMADLRESGAIEQDCDNIIFLHKPGNEELKKGVDSRKLDRDFINEIKRNGWDLLEFIISKQRNGPTGVFYMVYENRYLDFIDILK